MSDSQCHLVTTTSFHSIAIGNSSAAAFPSGVFPAEATDCMRSHHRSCTSPVMEGEQDCIPHSDPAIISLFGLCHSQSSLRFTVMLGGRHVCGLLMFFLLQHLRNLMYKNSATAFLSATEKECPAHALCAFLGR